MGLLYIRIYLELVTDEEGGLGEDYFFNRVKVALLLTFEEYIDRWCKKQDRIPPTELSASLKEKAEKIDAITKVMKLAIEGRKSLKVIYNIMMRYRNEVGFDIPDIPELE